VHLDSSITNCLVKINLDSPTGRKLKRKNSAEPTMTLHTKAANEEMLDIFNQPLGQVSALGDEPDSGDESEYDTDDYTSGGESTGTGRISAATSECGDDDRSLQSVQSAAPDSTEPQSISEWSEFTKSKHVPALRSHDSKESHGDSQGDFHTGLESIPESAEAGEDPSEVVEPFDNEPDSVGEPEFVGEIPGDFPDEAEELDFIAPGLSPEKLEHIAPAAAPSWPPLSIPQPPEDFHIPTNPYRDPEQVAQSRLPFMTPIVERTECSFPSIKGEAVYYSAKTPSRRRNEPDHTLPQIDDLLLSSPFQEIVNESRPDRLRYGVIADAKPQPAETESPLIKDKLCSPLNQSIRSTILEAAQPFLDSLPTYHDHHPTKLNKGPDLRKFSKSMKSLKPGEKTPPGYPSLTFPDSTKYTITRELGKGGFAPVYLAVREDECSESSSESSSAIALKAEEPSSAWEFYLMTLAHSRLAGQRAAVSLAQPLGLELFADEGYLLESYHDQGTVLDLSNLSKAEAAATGGAGLIDEAVAMFFAVELLRTMAALHEQGILHGDIKADNCLVRLGTLGQAEWSGRYMADGSGGWCAKGEFCPYLYLLSSPTPLPSSPACQLIPL
jgi:checkpoint serine/threonine-protein kinase